MGKPSTYHLLIIFSTLIYGMEVLPEKNRHLTRSPFNSELYNFQVAEKYSLKGSGLVEPSISRILNTSSLYKVLVSGVWSKILPTTL